MDGITIVANKHAQHQASHQKALAEGFKKHGVPVTLSHTAQHVKTDRVACWGWRLGKVLRAAGHAVLVVERGYVGDRFSWSSLGWNGLNNRATVPPVPNDPSRFKQHFGDLLKPWNPQGSYILLIGQVPGDASLQGKDLSHWYAQQASKDWGKPVKFRPHPMAYRKGPIKPVPKTTMMNGDLSAALDGAAWVVTFNSNCGVDAYLAGKPTHVDDEGSMAWNVTDREQWAYRLAWRQWTLEEISNGYALEHVGLTDGI